MKKRLLLYILISISLSGLGQTKKNEISFPEPFMFSVHDLGWMTGTNEGDTGEKKGPYRAGVDREFDVEDYEALINIAREAGSRIRGMFVTCELDRLNILRKYPTTTPAREKWDNSARVSKKQFDVVEYVLNNADYLEFGLHGVCHGYWTEDGKMHPEWCRRKDEPWPVESVRNHISAMKNILAQYGLSPENGHSFPESFDAGNNSYYWNPTPGENEYSLGELLSREGCRFVSNDLGGYPAKYNPPSGDNAAGFDNGIMVMCKGGGGVPWYRYANWPEEPAEKQECNMLRLHFPNFLAQDKFLQDEVNSKFVAYYKNAQAVPERYVAKNTEQFYSQWLYQKYSKVSFPAGNEVVIDNREMPGIYSENGFVGNLVLKVKLEPSEHIESAEINGNQISGYFEDQGYGFLYLPPLNNETYRVKYKKGQKTQMPHVYNDGTYNIYAFSHREGDETEIKLRQYGTQVIKIRNVTNRLPRQVSADSGNIKIGNLRFDKDINELQLTVSAHDFQGETGVIHIQY